MKKRIVTMILAIALCVFVPVNLTACTPRDQILRIYNWGDYMSPETLDGFADWYAKHPDGGGKIKVKEVKYDTNETMYNKVVNNGADFDLICPSEYMLERMINQGKVKKLYPATQAVIKEAVYDKLGELIEFDPNFEYSMPYIWGTFGIMYNAKSTTKTMDEMSTWSVLFPENSSKSIYMKNSYRDSYSVALLYDNSDELIRLSNLEGGYENAEYQALLKSIFQTISDDSIASAESILKAQKKFVTGYEVDDAKNTMSLDESGERGEFGLFWSCDAGYVMSEEEESSFGCGGGKTNTVNKNLRYVVPKEGSNVWLDSFAIPTTSQNEKAANLFIQYLCEQEQGYNNMVYTGGTSAVKSAMEVYYDELDQDESGFFEDADPEFKTMFMEMMFPSEATLKRCAIMKDFPDHKEQLEHMWERVLKAS